MFDAKQPLPGNDRRYAAVPSLRAAFSSTTLSLRGAREALRRLRVSVIEALHLRPAVDHAQDARATKKKAPSFSDAFLHPVKVSARLAFALLAASLSLLAAYYSFACGIGIPTLPEARQRLLIGCAATTPESMTAISSRRSISCRSD